jgi:hypothetical protein
MAVNVKEVPERGKMTSHEAGTEATSASMHPDLLQTPKSIGKERRIFGRDVKTLEGLMSPEFRRKVRRVVLPFEHPGLSWPIIHNAGFAQILPKNFPNSEVVDYTGVVSLVKLPDTCRLVSLSDADKTAGMLAAGAESAIAFQSHYGSFNPYGEASYLRKISALAVDMPDFRMDKFPVVHVVTSQRTKIFDAKGTYENYDQMKEGQYKLFRLMGLDGVPPEGERLVLQKDDFSRQLQEAVARVEAQVGPQAGGRPLVVLNNAKRFQDHFTHGGDLAVELCNLMRELDVAVVANMGPVGDRWGLREQAERLEASLKGVKGGKARLLEFGPASLVDFAALAYVTEKSGGCLLDVLGGASLLADWMAAPEVLIETKDWGGFIKKRPNMEVLQEDGLVGRVVPAVRKVLGV